MTGAARTLLAAGSVPADSLRRNREPLEADSPVSAFDAGNGERQSFPEPSRGVPSGTLM